MDIVVFGAGYVGLICVSSTHHNVCCIDTHPEKVAALQKGRLPIYDSSLKNYFEQTVHRKALQFTTVLPQLHDTALYCDAYAATQHTQALMVLTDWGCFSRTLDFTNIKARMAGSLILVRTQLPKPRGTTNTWLSVSRNRIALTPAAAAGPDTAP